MALANVPAYTVDGAVGSMAKARTWECSRPSLMGVHVAVPSRVLTTPLLEDTYTIWGFVGWTAMAMTVGSPPVQAERTVIHAAAATKDRHMGSEGSTGVRIGASGEDSNRFWTRFPIYWMFSL